MRAHTSLGPMLNVRVDENPSYLIGLGVVALLGCVAFALSLFIADVVVPDHDWVADTISDLAAGKYEYIADLGIYAFSVSLIAVALMASHAHLGDWRWSAGIAGLVLLALVVFLIGARNEYGDHDQDGAEIHIYLVLAVGGLMAVVPWLLSSGAARAGETFGKVLVGISLLWIVSAPIFFLAPTEIDGIYERYLGLIAFSLVGTMATLFIMRAREISYG